ncbi:hypothetical protein [Poritiphilus flavus]|uniref:Uncharacterized protein n=1 Tax=Poritiphilus flavus TaxID=2697053 RepID=A0A6L9EHR1_9FLAO|nr:hypothetical protein [Poritiphilus flavus]NAS14192.1 hypothetical protein [Poritiphilus flavus]
MKRYISFFVMGLVVSVASAQYSGQLATNLSAGGDTQGIASATIASLLGPIVEADAKRTLEVEEFQGSPYVDDNFRPTTIFYRDEEVGSLFYRYNALNEEVEIKQQNLLEEGIRALGRDKNISIYNNGKPMSFKTFIDRKGKTTNGYLTLLHDGETFDLYKRTHVKFTEGSPAQNSFVKATPNRFAHFEEYYMQKNGVDRIDEILLKKNQLIKAVGGDKQALSGYIKDNSLDLKNEADLIKFFAYLK